MAITLNKAKELVDDLLQALDSKLLGSRAFSKFYSGNREMLQQGLSFNTFYLCRAARGLYDGVIKKKLRLYVRGPREAFKRSGLATQIPQN
jgi:hypothetical protein